MRKSSRLPNLRNLGVNLRILIIINAAIALSAFVLSNQMDDFFLLIASTSSIAQPILLLCLLLLYACLLYTSRCV